MAGSSTPSLGTEQSQAGEMCLTGRFYTPVTLVRVEGPLWVDLVNELLVPGRSCCLRGLHHVMLGVLRIRTKATEPGEIPGIPIFGHVTISVVAQTGGGTEWIGRPSQVVGGATPSTAIPALCRCTVKALGSHPISERHAASGGVGTLNLCRFGVAVEH